MFLGRFERSLDDKGRVILPAGFREQLAEGAVIGRGLDGCLWVHTEEEFRRVADEVKEKEKRGALERQAARTIFSGARTVKPDRQGRVAVSDDLRGYAGLARDVVVLGVYSRIELWDVARWRAREAEGAAALAAGEGLSDFM